MKKILIAYGALVVVIILLAFARFKGASIIPGFSSGASAQVQDKKIKLLIADDEEEKRKGLSNRKELKEDTGMIFLFEKSDKYSFWMKDVSFSLDLIYLQGDTVVDIIKNVPPQAGKQGTLPVYTPTTDANRVLEVQGGFSDKNGLKIGDKIKFDGVK